MSSAIRWDQDAEGIVVLTIDDPNQSANTMNETYVHSMAAAVERLEAERDDIAGVVLTSGKPTFFAGGDLNDLLAAKPEDAPALAERVREIKFQLRRLETLGRPVVAAIDGPALGGGLEIALAAHHRVAVDRATIKLGFPEVQLGLLPGGGGVVRSVRRFGVGVALTTLLLEGRRYTPEEAFVMGLVDEVVPDADELLPAAKRWIAANPDAKQPWDQNPYTIPGGAPSKADLATILSELPTGVRRQLERTNYPALHHIVAAAVEGARAGVDEALELEGRYFVDVAVGQVAKNMIQAFFFDLQQVKGHRGRPAGRERYQANKAVVAGAGMMGAAIAYVCAAAGIEVVLKDVSLDTAERGKRYSEKLVAKNVQRGKASREDGNALLARIMPTADAAEAAGADLVIEAVFEDPTAKAEVFAELEPHLAADALVGSNTSTLPITELGEAVGSPANFIGLHFFSPVDRMPLLEIIKGEETSVETLHRALDLARQIRKTPIVVNDSRGFFTSRVIGTFINEGIAMLAEGVPAALIERASNEAGYPAPVLQLSDELNLKLLRRIRFAAQAAVEGDGATWEPHPTEAVVDRMLDEFGRGGRAAGAGFYDYGSGAKRLGLWSGLDDAFGGDNRDCPLDDLKERMLFIESIEAVKCLDEGVIESVADANVGSILGIGFPGWTGGVLQYVNGYAGGINGFVARAEQLAERYGERFRPPGSLVDKTMRGETLYDKPGLANVA